MATNFPASLDTLTNPTSSDSLSSPSHSAQHANVNDAVEALQAKVGADSSAVTTSHDYKIAQLEARDTAGLVLLDATDFTTASSISVNNVFSSTYSNYMVMFSTSDTSDASVNIRMRLRAGGVDETSASNFYRYNRHYNFTSTRGADGGNYNYWYMSDATNVWPDSSSFQALLFNPGIAQRTTGYTVAHAAAQSLTDVRQTISMLHKAQTAYDGFTLYPTGGTITGKVRVYGLVDS